MKYLIVKETKKNECYDYEYLQHDVVTSIANDFDEAKIMMRDIVAQLISQSSFFPLENGKFELVEKSRPTSDDIEDYLSYCDGQEFLDQLLNGLNEIGKIVNLTAQNQLSNYSFDESCSVDNTYDYHKCRIDNNEVLCIPDLFQEVHLNIHVMQDEHKFYYFDYLEYADNEITIKHHICVKMYPLDI